MLRAAPRSYLNALCVGALAFAGLAGCQDGAEFAVNVDTKAIVNGDVSVDDTQVVALVYSGKQFCSGTVVGKRTIVTAAHCLPPNVPFALSSIEVFFGTDVASGSGQFRRVVDGIANPAWNADVVAGDVGVLALAQDAPVAAMPMAFLDVTAAGMLGGEARAIGFGITSADGDGNGTRRTGMVTVNRVDASSIYLQPGPSATCNGDSGGALFFMQDGVEVLGGIHSRSDCGSAIIAERVDVHTMDFIMPFIEEHEGASSCGADGMCATGCADADPDCPCVADGICSDVCVHPDADVDCSAECAADGTCNESCASDADCSTEESDVCPEGDASCESSDGGCSAGGSASSSWMALALLLLLIRKRRAATLASS